MYRLFSELFRKCGGACLEVCETISKGLGEVFGGKLEENYPETNQIKIGNILLKCIKSFI